MAAALKSSSAAWWLATDWERRDSDSPSASQSVPTPISPNRQHVPPLRMQAFTQPESWGTGKVTRADLDEFKSRLGGKSSTMQDAMRYGELEMKIRPALGPQAHEEYKARIMRLKDTASYEAGAAEANTLMKGDPSSARRPGMTVAQYKSMLEYMVADFEKRILASTPAKVAKVARKAENVSLGCTRVRIISTGEVGTAQWAMVNSRSEETYTVRLPEGVVKQVARAGLQKVCLMCDADAVSKCPCGGTWYCGVACQKRHWKEHKKVCPKVTNKKKEAGR
jgi:hypothetical protein